MGHTSNKSRSHNKTVKRKRWKKGQSSNSNPLTKKFRDAAKSRFFSPPGKVNESSSLTVDALARHDESQTDQDGDDVMFDREAVSVGASTSGHTFKTWASNWTECTNTSFNNVHRFWASNDAQHREILAVLAAVTEVIKAQGGNETETEYFGALVTTLTVTEGEQSLSAVAYLLTLVLKRVPATVLKSRFSEVSKTILDLLARYADGESSSLLKSLLLCLALILRVQERAVWKTSSTHQVYRGLLTFVTHKKPKVRKSAHRAVCIILKGSLFMMGGEPTTHHPAAAITAKYCVTQIGNSGGSGGSVETLHILGLLKDILGVLPQSSVKSLCETILRVLTLGSVMVTTCGMQALHGLFSSRPTSSTLPPDLNAQLITALYDYQPAENDVQPMRAWLTVMEKAHVNLSRLDEKLCISHLPRIFSAGMACLLSDKPEVAQHATKTLKKLAELCLPVDCIQAMMESTVTPIHKVVRALESGLSYQFHSSWGMVLQLFAVVIEAVGKHCHKLFQKCLCTIAELRESSHFPFKGELDHTIGCAVKVLGPRLVLEAVQLKITGEIDDTSFSRSWLLPVMRDNIMETELGFFTAYFLPLAARLRLKAEQLQEEENIALAQTYDTLQLQIWSLLPGFCTRPTDLTQSFKGIAKVFGSAINDRPDLRMKVMSSLRKLVAHSLDHEESKHEISQFSKNFLPIFFNLYTTEIDEDKENSRLAVLETVKCYLQITSSELVLTFCDGCIKKMNEKSVAPFRRHALLDLAIAMVTYVDMAHLKQLYQFAVSNLQTMDKTLQKKCYKVLEIICKCQSNESKLFVKKNLSMIQTVLLESLSTSSPSSKAPRLRCLISIFQQMEEEQNHFLRAVIPEAIMCTREIGERARTAAYILLVEIGRAVIRLSRDSLQGGLTSYIGLVLAGLAGSPQMISSTLLALTRILFEFKNDIPRPMLEMIINSVCTLLNSKAREVIKSALGFIKVLLSAYTDTNLACHLKKLMSSLVGMQDDCRHHFRFKAKEIYTKLIRKFGYETIYGMAPTSIQKVLVNIRKTTERTKRKNIEYEQEEQDDEEEHFRTQHESIDEMLRDTDSEMEEDVKKTKVNKQKKTGNKQGKTWLAEAGEDIIDFLDPSATKKVMATKPTEKATDVKKQLKNRGFKMATDGRLIITQESDEDVGGEEDDDELDELLEAFESGKNSKSRGKKRKVEDIASDSESPSKPKYQAGGHGIHRPLQKTKKSGSQYGTEYKAKKAGGDMKKRGKPDPYAYVPLKMQSLNKRKQAKMQGQFKHLVRGAKKGAIKGMKTKRKKH